MRKGLFIAAALLPCWLCLTGCTLVSSSGSTARTSIEEIHLVTMPLALNLNSVPGADGFAVKIYAVNRKQPKTLAIENGVLEVLMFDGVVQKAATPGVSPLKVWTFTPADLTAVAVSTSIGTAYSFTLLWGDQQPRQDRISVGARYRPPGNGPPMNSALSTIMVVSQ
jgi:hypothetical protein